MIPLHSDTAGRARVRTSTGVPVGQLRRLSPEARARLRRKLERGPFLARFNAGFPAYLVGEIWIGGERAFVVHAEELA